MSHCSRLLIAALAILLAGCGHMPVTSMVRLARVDFTTTDPAALRAAVKLPDVLTPRPSGIKMRIAVRVGAGPEESEEFILQDVSDPREVLALREELEPGARIFAYRLSPEDLPRVAAFRAAMMERGRRTGGGGALSIAIRPEACRTGPLPAGAILFSTYLRTVETGGYVALTRNVDLRGVDASRDVAALVPPCG